MSHTLSSAQSSLVALLTAAAVGSNILNGIPIAKEQFGQPDPSAAIEAALSDTGPGLCILSIAPYSTRIESTGNQDARLMISLPIVLLENPARNSSAGGGANKNPLQVVEAIWKAGASARSKGPQIQLGASPLEVIDENYGMRIYAIDFEVQSLFQS